MISQYLVDIIERDLSLRIETSRYYSDKEFKDLIGACVDKLSEKTSVSEAQKAELLKIVFNAHRKLGIIQPLLDDPEVNEIMINGTEAIYVEKGGKMVLYESRYTDAMQLFNVIQAMVSWVNRSVNESSPIVDSRLADGSRVNIVLRPVAINGPVVTIRKFSEKSFTMETLIENETLCKEEADFLAECVKSGVNIFVSGGTSSGKTTFLNVLSGYIDFEERIITVEDSAELRLPQPNIVRLETKNSNSEGKGEIGMRKLIKTALRMRPDRIIVGEVRDESALDMLQAMCTGHDGSMSTAHANSAQDTLTRIETMALWEGNISGEAIRKQIASGLDLIVHLKRDSVKGRRVAEIAEVVGCDEGGVCLHSLFCEGQKLCECQEGGKVYEKIRSKSKR
ncbi:MAG: CpaF family protein [Clostridia bacterium]|nr:CpaF family protein [Clostridia bacterium]